MTFKLAGNSVTLQGQRQPDEPQLHLIQAPSEQQNQLDDLL